jgi:hypothetical protein
MEPQKQLTPDEIERNQKREAIKADLQKKYEGKNEDLTELLLDEAANAELRRRDHQAAFVQSRQEVSKLSAQNEFLFNKAQEGLDLSSIQNEELDKMKLEDPDKWMDTVTKLKTQKKADFDATIQQGLSDAEAKANQNFANETRQQTLERFIEANPDFNILDEKIASQIPPMYVNQLADGTLPYGEFLEKAKQFVTGVKTTANQTPQTTNTKFNQGSGRTQVEGQKVHEQKVQDYKNLKI